ncbi:thioredoxin family protein [Nocardioides panacisoli]|uniref:TlpA family protein disulfide reductase n=1 Tax=Nocardioides panacisoli TaxID=627624 RepID=UPI001C629E66|nr:thioredoxin family protein [Nocardioides panacisoli]QYJ03949.1 thioredoxin family protein [Nocardioides panacisoli]
MTTGLLILGLAVLGAAGFAAYRARTDGRFTVHAATREPRSPVAEPVETVFDRVADAVPGAELGERATFVQFSSAFCAPCRATRVLLDDVATNEDGVAHVEVDAEHHLELVRALGVQRTPTTLVLDAAGAELTRAAGAPQRHQVLAAIPAAT